MGDTSGQLKRLPYLDRMPTVLMIQRARLGPHGLSRYSLPQAWAVHLYLGSAKLAIGAETAELRKGSVSITAPGAVSVYQTAGALDYYYAHFSAPSFDWDTGCTPFLAIEEPEDFIPSFEGALEYWPIDTLRCGIRLWDLLLEVWMRGNLPISPRPEAGPCSRDGRLNSYVREAIAYVERNLSRIDNAEEVSAAVGLSTVYLARLFREELGAGIASWVRRRRLETARHELENSTKPIKTIALEVGFSDLHAFNKLCRNAWGVSPRRLRSRDG